MADSIRFQRSDGNHNPCKDINALAATIYDSDAVLSADILERWYSADPHIFWLAYNNESLVGYLSLIPLHEVQYQKIFATDFDERTITAENVLPFDDATHFLLSSIAIHPAYRSKSATASAHLNSIKISRELRVNMLIDLFHKRNVAPNIPMQASQIKAVCIASEAITVQGEYMLQSLGLKYHSETRPGNKVYFGEIHPDDSVIPVLVYHSGSAQK